MKTRGAIVALAAAALVTLLVTFSVSYAQDPIPPVSLGLMHIPTMEQTPSPPQPQMAPLRAETKAPLPPGTGFIQAPMDLSHLTGQSIPGSTVMGTLPDEFDWRDKGGQDYVTPVENQNPCGSCYTFGFLGSFESRLLIDGAGTFDFSQNHAKECNWRELSNFQYPSPGDYWGSCDGGNAFMLASLFSQTGTVLESCDPHVPSDVECKGTCPYQKTLLDWRLINGGSIPDTQVLKQYIYDHGPVITSMDVNAGEGFDNSYDGSYTFNYTTPGDTTDHCVLITGWSDNLPPVSGGTGPADGWIVRNSWGTGWGDNGYFYMTYGAANIGSASSFVHDWQDYDPNGDVWYYDDDGWWGSWGFNDPTGWGLAKFIPDSNTSVTRVEFWTTDATTDVDVYVYDDFDGSVLSNKRAEALNNAYGEAGYHSVELSPPVQVTAGDDVIAVVKFTNQGYGYPIPTDPHGNIETGRTYMSESGSSWIDMGANNNTDVAIRLRTSIASPQAPSLTDITPSSGLNTGVVNITNLSGSNFQAEATVKLAKPGQTDIHATNVSVADASRITCEFDLTGAAIGSWHVVVTNPDARSATLPNGFLVRAPGGGEYALYLPLAFRNYPPIPDTPYLEPIDNSDGDGSYTVRWSMAARADTYTLYEYDNAAFLRPTPYPPTTNLYRAVNGKGPGTYYYRVKASNAWGDSGWSTARSVRVSPPTTFYPVADTTVMKGTPDTNWGDMDSIRLGYDLEGCRDSVDGKAARGLVKFDLSAVPVGTPISEARLHLLFATSCYYRGHTQARTVTTYRVKSPWSESSVKWQNKPGYGEAYGSASVGVDDDDLGWHSFDVTTLVRNWVDGSSPNYGLMIRAPEGSGDDFVRFEVIASEWSGTSFDPYLEIQYAGMKVSEQMKPGVGGRVILPVVESRFQERLGVAPASSDDGWERFLKEGGCCLSEGLRR